MFLVCFVLCFALVHSVDEQANCPDGGSSCSSTISTCANGFAKINAANSDFVTGCTCLNNAYSSTNCTTNNAVTNCAAVGLEAYVACTELAAFSRALGSVAQPYDFQTCTACGSNLPNNAVWPRACTIAALNFLAHLIPFNRTIDYTLTIPNVCDALGQFYDDFASCGFPGVNRDILIQYVCNNTQIVAGGGGYGIVAGICECGTHRVSGLGQRVIEILKSIANSLATYLSNKGSLGVVTVDIIRTYSCNDRLVLNFAGSFDGSSIKNAYAAFLGIPASRIKVGINIQDSMVAGKCVDVIDFTATVGKRDEQVGMATVQITNSVGSIVVSMFLVALISVLYLF